MTIVPFTMTVGTSATKISDPDPRMTSITFCHKHATQTVHIGVEKSITTTSDNQWELIKNTYVCKKWPEERIRDTPFWAIASVATTVFGWISIAPPDEPLDVR